jgi:[protein-PII] uridylyltransferase
MEDAYFAAFTRAEQVGHLELSRRAAMMGGAAARAQVRPHRNATEVVVAARDRRGLFADLALAIARLGGNLVGARIFTSQAGDALDVFYIQDAAGHAFGEDRPRGLDRLVHAIEAAARGDVPPEVAERPTPDLGRASAFAISPGVVIDNDASPAATIVEATGRDRPGLVHALARALADAGLSIQSAHIDNYGERAVDSFYVVTADGGKLTNLAHLADVRQRLFEMLDAGDAPARRARLARAQASPAR